MDNDGSFNKQDLEYIGINPEVKSELTIYSEGPISLDEIISDIKTNPYFEGYNRDTLTWMESLNQKKVFISDNSYVIMNENDASKINTLYITDVYIEEYINCIIVENHSLGGNSSKDVLLVKDVTNLGNYTYYYEV